MLAQATQYLTYRRVFASHADVQAFRAVRNHPDAGTRQIRVRGVPHPLTVRGGTVDPITLYDAFHAHFHVPDADGPMRTIVDLGANAGYTAVDLAVRFPDARIIALELDADNAAVAQRNVAPFGDRVTLLHAGIWTESGTIAYGGVKVDDYAIGHGTRTAPVISPADLVARYGLGLIDYLKMDIEGAENVVLPACLLTMNIRHLQVEVHPPATMERIGAELAAHGFSVWRHRSHQHSLYASHPDLRRPH